MGRMSMTVLEDILAARVRGLEETRRLVPLERIQIAAEARRERRDFAAALGAGGLRVIAEAKKASPSRGLMCSDYQPAEIARAYERAGAAALSVLTEEEFFLGSLADLESAREAVSLPVLRKDFVLGEYQLYESVAAGADGVLLIVAALPEADLHKLIKLADQLQMAALVEAHTEDELKRAVDAKARIIGVNNRNLKTLEVNLEVSLRLRESIPHSCLAVSESGIKTAADLERLSEAGYDAVLIGEHLIASGDPGAALGALIQGISQSGVRSVR